MKQKLVLTTFWILTIAPMAVQAQSFLTNGLVAYYPFNGNTYDASGNGRTLTNMGAILTTNRFNQPNSAYLFNGTSSIMIQTDDADSLILGSSWTLSCWVNLPTNTVNYSLIRHDGDASMVIVNEYGHIADSFYVEALNFNYMGYTSYAQAPPLGQWCMLTATWGETNFEEYINGRPQVTAQASSPGSTPTETRICLGNSTIYGQPLLGVLDDVRIYNRPLSAFEVQELYLYESVPLPCVPHRATATAVLTNGSVAGATMTDAGCGYTNTPLVLVLGGGGNGATAIAIVSNGIVASVTISSGGSGYTNPPTIYIYSPMGLQIGLLKAVQPSFSDLLIGSNYQLQVSGDMNTWTNQGSPFTAANPTMTYPQYWNVDNWNQLFFRLQMAP